MHVRTYAHTHTQAHFLYVIVCVNVYMGGTLNGSWREYLVPNGGVQKA